MKQSMTAMMMQTNSSRCSKQTPRFGVRASALSLILAGAALVLWPSISPVVVAQATDEVHPADAPPIPQRVVKHVLANGLEVNKQDVPGSNHVVILIELKSGDNHDPASLPGLSQLLVDVVMTGGTIGEEGSGRTPTQLSEQFPNGWNAQSFPDHSVLSWVVPHEQAVAQLSASALKITRVEITSASVGQSLTRMRKNITRRFEEEIQLIPMSWVTTKAFTHTARPRYGIAPEKLQRLSAEDVQSAWQRRIHPRNIRLFVVGDLEASGLGNDAIDIAISSAFGEIQPAEGVGSPDFKVNVQREKQGERRRRILVDNVPSNKEHVVVAYYAPDIADQDHPAFLTVCNEFMHAATRLPGAQGRVAFQYSMLLDPRAAYLVPHIWRFPKGADQALGFWLTKLKNKRFSNTDGRATGRQLAWQLGEPLNPAIITEMRDMPSLLYTIAYATALRTRHGDARFWNDYRDRLQKLRKDDLKSAREKYLGDDNIAVFVLTPKESH